MNYIQLTQQIKKNQIPAISLVYGTEPYFTQNIKHLFIKKVLKEEENLATYDLKETSIQEVITDVETYPFFGDRKLIFATNPIFLQPKPEKVLVEGLEHDLSVLERYLNDPVDYSVLVFLAPYEGIDQRKKISKLFKKKAVVTECNPIKPYEQSKWINELAAGLNIKIDNNAYDLFEGFSSDLHQLESELTKMSLFVGENGTITKDVAEQLISHTSTSSSLKLADAVINRDLPKAISIYKDLEKMNEEPIALIGLLAFQFRSILRVKLLKQKGYNQAQIQKQIGGHPYVIKIASDRERRFSEQKLKNIIDMLATTDATIKQGKMDKGLAFEILLYNLIQK